MLLLDNAFAMPTSGMKLAFREHMTIPGLRSVERHEAAIRLTLVFAATGTCIGFVLALYLVYLFPGIPRSVLLVEWASAILFAGGMPFIARTIRKSSVPVTTPRKRPTDLRLSERRQGGSCRRSTARVGGRRRTDMGMLLATASGQRSGS
jgi:hypothetical protein